MQKVYLVKQAINPYASLRDAWVIGYIEAESLDEAVNVLAEYIREIGHRLELSEYEEASRTDASVTFVTQKGRVVGYEVISVEICRNLKADLKALQEQLPYQPPIIPGL